MSNRVVDIVERCLRETFCMTSGCEQTALAILAALEKEGARVMWREPTVEMNCAAWSLVRDRWPKGQFMGPGPAFREAMAAMWDAAPRYGAEED